MTQNSSSEDTTTERERERERENSIQEKAEDEQRNDDTENGGKGQRPEPVGFWDSSLNQVRKAVIIAWARTTLILMTFIIAVLSLYWAVLFNEAENLEALKVGVINFDAQIPPYTDTIPLIGPLIVQMTEKEAQSPMPHLGFSTQPPSLYNNDPIAVRQAVYDQKLWAAIIINANATTLLEEAVHIGNTSYDPLGACQIIYIEARQETTYEEYVIPMLTQLQIEITSSFGEMWAKRVMKNTTLSHETMSRVPQAISPAIGFSTYNLRPFMPATATPAVTIGLIYLIIIAFFSFSFYLPIHTKYLLPQGHPPLHFWQMVIWRYLATLLAYLFLSLAYSFVSLAFQIPFSNSAQPDTTVAMNPDAYGRGTFSVYWMLNFFGMIALGFASENVTMFIGQPWTGLWLIFWVITNVCTSFYEITLSPRFFYWGYAWPLHNIVEASRTILFGVHSRIGLNFGILIVWGVVNTLLFPVACTFMRWKSMKGEGKKPSLAEVIR